MRDRRSGIQDSIEPEPGPDYSRSLVTNGRILALLAITVLLPACGTGGGKGTLNPTVAPEVPGSLEVRPGNGSATLLWTASSAASAYSVRHSLSPGGPYLPAPGGSAVIGTTYRDPGLVNGRPYHYVVAAVNAFGESGLSAEGSVTPGIFARTARSGAGFTLAVLADGSLWAWGSNLLGQLGPESGAALSPVGVEVPLDDVVGLAAGNATSYGLRSDGSVYAWGDNSLGQLGIGDLSVVQVDTPVACRTPSGIIAVAAAGDHALALRDDGTVWIWGGDSKGLGIVTGSGSPLTLPTQVAGVSDAVQVAVGGGHVLVLRSDGRLLAWGSNSDGQLGDGTTVSRTTPQQVSNLDSIVEIRAGAFGSMALAADGSVWTWGNATTAGRPGPYLFPGAVPGLSGIRSVHAGTLFAAGLRFDGTVWAWGNGPMLNDNSPTTQTTPIPVPGLQNIKSLHGGPGTLLAIDGEGRLWGCGDNFLGELGTGSGAVVPSPVQTLELDGISGISGGAQWGLALRNDHSIWSWGSGTHGTLGNNQAGTGVKSPHRVKVQAPSGLSTPIAVSGGTETNLAINSDGTVWTWGRSFLNSLGNGTASGVDVSVPAAIPSLSGITRVAAGNLNGFAVGAGGAVWGWGNNAYGDVGCNSTAVSIAIPTAVTGLTGVTSIAAGGFGAVAVAGGQVRAWGRNDFGGLGNGSTTVPARSIVPVNVPGMTGFTSVAAGETFYMALRSDGTVWTWGGTPTPSGTQATPFQIPGLPTITAVAAGQAFGLGLASDGTVWTWGRNDWGQLGNSTFLPGSVTTFAPAQVPGLGGVVAVSAQSTSAMALKNDGTVWGWGRNSDGQLGVGTLAIVTKPTMFSK